MLQFGREAYNQAVAPGITSPLHATDGIIGNFMVHQERIETNFL